MSFDRLAHVGHWSYQVLQRVGHHPRQVVLGEVMLGPRVEPGEERAGVAVPVVGAVRIARTPGARADGPPECARGEEGGAEEGRAKAGAKAGANAGANASALAGAPAGAPAP